MTELLSRKEAQKIGAVHYFTGKPCKRGHIAERRTSTRNCIECSRVLNVKHYWENPDRRRESAKKWYRNHRDEKLQYAKEYRERTVEQRAEYSRRYREQNPEKAAAIDQEDQRKRKENGYFKEYRDKNRARLTEKENRRRARKVRATPEWADIDAITVVYEKAQDLNERWGTNLHVDHILPLKSDWVCGLHTHDNLQLLAAEDNLSKSNRRTVN